MNAGKEFDYIGYKEQSTYNSLSRESDDLFAYKTAGYVPFDMRDLYPDDSEAKVKILQEIYDTERTYVTNLTVVDEVFIQQLALSCPKSRKCFRTMFGEISAICKTHQILLQSLRTLPVGQAFIKLIPFLKLYTSYATHYPRSLKVYAKLMARNDFRKALERIEQDSRCEGKKLQAFLIMPIQRIPRYIMLIESLMHQSTDQEEMNSLFKASLGMQGLSEEIQSCMTAFENGERLLTIQLNFGLDGHILEPGRVLVKEGTLYKREINGYTNYQETVVFLFNDILLYGHKRISVIPQCKYEPSAILSLRHCVIQHDEVGGCIFIRCGDVGVDFTADSLGSVEDWYKVIVTAIENAKVLRETLRKESFKQKSLVFDRGFWQRHRDRFRNIINTDMGAQVHRVLSRKKPEVKLNDSAFLRGVWSKTSSSSNRKRKSDRFDEGQDVIDSKKRVPTDPIFDYTKIGEPLVSMNPAILPNLLPDNEEEQELNDEELEKDFDWTDDDEYIPEEKKIPIRRVTSYGSYDEEDRRPRQVGGARRHANMHHSTPRRSLGVDDIRKLSYQPRTFEPFNMSAEDDDEEEEEEDIETKVKGERPRPWWEVEQVPPVIRNQKPSLIDTVKSNCSIM